MSIKYEYFDDNQNSGYFFYGVYDKTQTFTVGAIGTNVVHIVTSVKLLLRKLGSPTATATISIRATDVDGKPTGSNLASGTLDTSTLTASYAWYEVTLGSGALLLPSTKYAIVASCAAAIDTAAPQWGLYSSGGYTGGSTGSYDGATWSLQATQDFNFEEWGELYGSTPTGSMFPVDPITRVTALVHRYDRRAGIYQLEISLGDTTSVLQLPSSSLPRRATAEKEVEQQAQQIVGAAKDAGLIKETKKVQTINPLTPQQLADLIKRIQEMFPAKRSR